MAAGFSPDGERARHDGGSAEQRLARSGLVLRAGLRPGFVVPDGTRPRSGGRPTASSWSIPAPRGSTATTRGAGCSRCGRRSSVTAEPGLMVSLDVRSAVAPWRDRRCRCSTPASLGPCGESVSGRAGQAAISKACGSNTRTPSARRPSARWGSSRRAGRRSGRRRGRAARGRLPCPTVSRTQSRRWCGSSCIVSPLGPDHCRTVDCSTP